MSNENINYVNFNGIPKTFVHESKNSKGEPVYYVGITPVPYEFSKTGVASVRTKYVTPTKNDPQKYNIGFPENLKLQVSVCTFHDTKDASNNEYETVTMTAKELNVQQIIARKMIKEENSKLLIQAMKDAEKVNLKTVTEVESVDEQEDFDR